MIVPVFWPRLFLFKSPPAVRALLKTAYLCRFIFKRCSMISVDGLTVEFGGTTLFKNISYAINEQDKIALMGKNGAGKSTMLKILAGVRQPSAGRVSAPEGTVIAYLPQHLMTEDGRTVFEETAQAFAQVNNMQAEIEHLNEQLATDRKSTRLNSSH